MLQKVKQQAMLAFQALQEYSQNNSKEEQTDSLFGTSVSQDYRVRVEFHNVNLNLQYYPQYTLKLPHYTHNHLTYRGVFVVPEENEKLFSLQLPVSELMSINNDDNKKAQLLRDYDVVFIDESLKEAVHRYGGFELCNCGALVFINNLKQLGRTQINQQTGQVMMSQEGLELEAYKFTTVPSLNGTSIQIIIGNSALTPEQIGENVAQLLTLMELHIPFGLQNIKKVTLSKVSLGSEANLELPLYQSIKKPGQTLVPDIRSVQDIVADELRTLGIQNGLYEPQNDIQETTNEEKAIAAQ